MKINKLSTLLLALSLVACNGGGGGGGTGTGTGGGSGGSGSGGNPTFNPTVVYNLGSNNYATANIFTNPKTIEPYYIYSNGKALTINSGTALFEDFQFSSSQSKEAKYLLDMNENISLLDSTNVVKSYAPNNNLIGTYTFQSSNHPSGTLYVFNSSYNNLIIINGAEGYSCPVTGLTIGNCALIFQKSDNPYATPSYMQLLNDTLYLLYQDNNHSFYSLNLNTNQVIYTALNMPSSFTPVQFAVDNRNVNNVYYFAYKGVSSYSSILQCTLNNNTCGIKIDNIQNLNQNDSLRLYNSLTEDTDSLYMLQTAGFTNATANLVKFPKP